MLVKRNLSERQTDRGKTMKGIREEEKVQETPCTSLVGIFLSLFFKKLFCTDSPVQFKCQKAKTKPGPWHGRIVLSISRGAEWQISSSAPARAGITFRIWHGDCAAGLQGCEENRGGGGGGVVFNFEKGSAEALLCYVLHGEAGSQSCPLGKQSGMPVPQTQLQASWVCFAPFSDAHEAL